MSEQVKHNDVLSPSPDGQDVVALIKQMQKQLVFLENKIDLLINQSSGRPSSGRPFSGRPFSGRPSSGRPFSKPFRSFDRSRHHSDSAAGDAAGGKNFARGSHFGKRPSEENRGFDYKKKAYGDSRQGNFGQDRHLARRNDGQQEGFDQKRKPFSYKRKGPK